MFFALFQIAASNYFFPHWLQENQSPNWKVFYRFSGCHGRFHRETFLLRFFRRLHWNIRRHESFRRIMMSNNPRYRQSLTSPALELKLKLQIWSLSSRALYYSIALSRKVIWMMAKGGTCRNLMYSMVFLKMADLFIFASSPATIFFNSMILKWRPLNSNLAWPQFWGAKLKSNNEEGLVKN